jgi:two-component system, chemotaxis family, chemotaxis protein CheY
MNMLIVDDVMTNAIILKRMAMRVFGGDIDIETSSMAAINACHERKYDIIITDYMMPDLDGISMAGVLRNFSEFKHIPILMTSSCSDSVISNRAIRSGVTEFILKPVNAVHFRNRISHYLSQRPSAYAA